MSGRNTGGDKTSLCLFVAGAHGTALDSCELEQKKWRHPRCDSETRRVPWMNFLFQSVVTDIGFLQTRLHTGSESHSFQLSAGCRLFKPQSDGPWRGPN